MGIHNLAFLLACGRVHGGSWDLAELVNSGPKGFIPPWFTANVANSPLGPCECFAVQSDFHQLWADAGRPRERFSGERRLENGSLGGSVVTNFLDSNVIRLIIKPTERACAPRTASTRNRNIMANRLDPKAARRKLDISSYESMQKRV